PRLRLLPSLLELPAALLGPGFVDHAGELDVLVEPAPVALDEALHEPPGDEVARELVGFARARGVGDAVLLEHRRELRADLRERRVDARVRIEALRLLRQRVARVPRPRVPRPERRDDVLRRALAALLHVGLEPRERRVVPALDDVERRAEPPLRLAKEE